MSTVTLRLIIRRSPDGHQTPILTNRSDLTVAEFAYRIGNRWRQENHFKYGREHLALDALDSYADQSGDDLTRLVPNPAKHRATDRVKDARKDARKDLTVVHADLADALDTAVAKAGQPGNGGKALVDPAVGVALNAAQADLTAAKNTARKTPSHLPLTQVRPGSRLLETERKLLTHPIRMSAYNRKSRWPGSCDRTTPAVTTKDARCYAKRSPCPVTSRSTATPCTSAWTPPAPPDAARPSLHRTQRHRHRLLRHHADPHLQRQGLPRPRMNDLTMSGGLESRTSSSAMSAAVVHSPHSPSRHRSACSCGSSSMRELRLRNASMKTASSTARCSSRSRR